MRSAAAIPASPASPASPRTAGASTGERVVSAVAIVLTTIAGIQLLAIGDQTATFFAWTVNPPLAAGFLGASFWAVGSAIFLTAWTRAWDELPILAPVGTIVTTLVLLATILHLDKFHLTASDPVPLIAAWVWVVVYVAVPPVFGLMWFRDLQARSGRPARDAAAAEGLPPGLRAVLFAFGVVVAVVAAILFIAPGTLSWPWPLTPLTSRMTGSFLSGIAAVTFAMAIGNNLPRLRFAAVAMVGFGLLELVAIARFGSSFDTGTLGVLWLLFLAATIVLGAAVAVLASRARRS